MDARSRSYYHMLPCNSNKNVGIGKVYHELVEAMIEFRNKRNIGQLAERDLRGISISAMWAEMKGIVDASEIPWYALPCIDAIKTQEEHFQTGFVV